MGPGNDISRRYQHQIQPVPVEEHQKLETVDGVELEHTMLPPLLQAGQPVHGHPDQVSRHLRTQDVGFVLLREQHVLLEAVIF